MPSETQPTVFIMRSYAAQTSPRHPMSPEPCIYTLVFIINRISISMVTVYGINTLQTAPIKIWDVVTSTV